MQAINGTIGKVVLVPTHRGVEVEYTGRHGSVVLATEPDVDTAKRYVTDTYGRVKFSFDPVVGYETAVI